MTTAVRVGVGYDIHRLGEGRQLILAGMKIPFHLGLIGYSDGDVVLHALTDALLGAAGLPDIGDLFPDTDPAIAGADSRQLLGEVMQKVAAAGFEPNNADLIVHAEQPRLTDHKQAMAASIARLLGLDRSAVSVKAKTNEGLGPLGRADAIACTAVVTLRDKAGSS